LEVPSFSVTTENEAPRSAQRAPLVLVVVGSIASLVLITAVLWLPWATITGGAHGGTIKFTGGSLTRPVVYPALVVPVLWLAALRWPQRMINLLLLVASVIALLFAVLLALRSISSANSLAVADSSIEGAVLTQTSYALGSVLGVAAGVATVTVSAVGLGLAGRK